ncbi:hypothetical protein QJQ45_009615 [Haematococcus lacustris]|nr:hypothetical protein QJQ45_009615 [Haematococcus lacustris]
MGRRGQRSKKGSAIMAARVAACLAPWTRMAGFIANRLKELEVELQASQTQLGSDVAASQPREQRMQAQIEELQRHNGSEDASKAAGCSASPNYPAACASSSYPPPAPQSVQPGSAFQCCLGFVHLESHDAEHQCAKLIDCFKAAGYWTADVHSACLNPYQTH